MEHNGRDTESSCYTGKLNIAFPNTLEHNLEA